MSVPPYLHISMVLDRPSLGRLYDQVEASTGFPGFISYRMFGPPGSRQDQANMIAWLHQIRWEWLYDRLNRVASQLNAEHWQRRIEGGHRELQFTRYTPGEGYGWHSDVDPKADGQHARRTLSMVTLLREPDAGGGLELEGIGVIPMRPGDAVLFPAEAIHRAVPVVAGTRDSLIYWIGRSA